MKTFTLIFFLALLCPLLFLQYGAIAHEIEESRQLTAIKTNNPPQIDGLNSDPVWEKAVPLITTDPIAGIEISLKAVYTKEEIFLLAGFPDKDENREHKTMHWDPQNNRYVIGPEREDTFVLKWNMEPFHVDLTLHGDTPYEADIWYWKSHRTDPAGYADDKHQIYSLKESKKTKKLLSKLGRRFYLRRKGDAGSPAYKVKVYDSFTEAKLPLYEIVQPKGSRADIRAKGVWHKGFWYIEFGRKLITAHNDDVQLHPQRTYLLGVSRYEIAGRNINPTIDEPKFGSGDINDHIHLKFDK